MSPLNNDSGDLLDIVQINLHPFVNLVVLGCPCLGRMQHRPRMSCADLVAALDTGIAAGRFWWIDDAVFIHPVVGLLLTLLLTLLLSDGSYLAFNIHWLSDELFLLLHGGEHLAHKARPAKNGFHDSDATFLLDPQVARETNCKENEEYQEDHRPVEEPERSQPENDAEKHGIRCRHRHTIRIESFGVVDHLVDGYTATAEACQPARLAARADTSGPFVLLNQRSFLVHLSTSTLIIVLSPSASSSFASPHAARQRFGCHR